MGRLTAWIKPEPLVAVVLWGGIYPGAKLGLREIPVLSFTSLRLIVAAGILLALSGWHRLGVRRPAFGAVANAALAQTVFQLLLASTGQQLETARSSSRRHR